jgi:hypothetical protein
MHLMVLEKQDKSRIIRWKEIRRIRVEAKRTIQRINPRKKKELVI